MNKRLNSTKQLYTGSNFMYYLYLNSVNSIDNFPYTLTELQGKREMNLHEKALRTQIANQVHFEERLELNGFANCQLNKISRNSTVWTLTLLAWSAIPILHAGTIRENFARIFIHRLWWLPTIDSILSLSQFDRHLFRMIKSKNWSGWFLK